MALPPEDVGDWLHQHGDRIAAAERIIRKPLPEERRNLSDLDDWDLSYEDGERPPDGAVATWDPTARGGEGGWVAAESASGPTGKSIRLTVSGTGSTTGDVMSYMASEMRVGTYSVMGHLLDDSTSITDVTGREFYIRAAVGGPTIIGYGFLGTQAGFYDGTGYYAPSYRAGAVPITGHYRCTDPTTNTFQIQVLANEFRLNSTAAPYTTGYSSVIPWQIVLTLVPILTYTTRASYTVSL